MVLSTALIPFGKIYGPMMALRNALYDRGIFRSYDLGARTISVGNLTTGGTGKTPLVGLIAELLLTRGESVCILTRGYGRKEPYTRALISDGREVLTDADIGGDEPVELARKLRGQAIVIADPKRAVAGQWAMNTFSPTVFILDDGFQHRSVRRDLDIVCIDVTDPWGNERILPAGTLRESLKGLARANAIVLTRTDLVSEREVDAIILRIREANNSASIFRLETRIGEFRQLNSYLECRRPLDEPEDVQPPAAYAFCGLGNPDSFTRNLTVRGVNLVGTRYFPDHVRYSQRDIDTVESSALERAADSLITTAKDAVKLGKLKFNLPVFVAELEPKIANSAEFEQLLTSF